MWEKEELKMTPKILILWFSWIAGKRYNSVRQCLKMQGRFRKKAKDLYMSQIELLTAQLWELWYWEIGEIENIPEVI